MPNYKSIITISFEFESKDPLTEATEKAKSLIDAIVNQAPKTKDYNKFAIDFDVVHVKGKDFALTRLKEYKLEQLFSWITNSNTKKTIRVNKKAYSVKLNSDRYHLFKINSSCAACGLQGTRLFLECIPGESVAHFNLYGEEDGQLILMTNPKALNGPNKMDNYATCCQVCNTIKASYPLDYENVKILREIMKNPDKLSAKQLRAKINATRLSLVSALTGQ